MVNKTNNTPNNNTIEMYNGYMMDKLGLSERQVQRLIKSIEEAGFINVKRAKAKKQPNKITINDAINGDKNVTLNNAIDCAVSNENTNNAINDAINGDKNGDKNVTLNKDEIKNNNINPVEQGPVVIKTIKENKKPVEQTTVVIKEKKENEMNERSECNGMNATNGMSVVNGMNENEVKRNDAISSTFEDNYTPDVNLFKPQFDEDDFNKVFGLDSNTVAEKPQEDTTPNDVFKSSSVTSNGEGSIFKENCTRNLTPPNSAQPPLSLNHSGCVEKRSVEQLPTEEEKVQQSANKCPQIEFDNKRMQELFSLSEKETNFERFKEYIRQMDEYMQYLRANDPYLFKQYKKEIYCWYQRNSWDMDMNFICVGGDFRRKYA
jgi:hypothetical protein